MASRAKHGWSALQSAFTAPKFSDVGDALIKGIFKGASKMDDANRLFASSRMVEMTACPFAFRGVPSGPTHFLKLKPII
jgi:hypothetical protein